MVGKWIRQAAGLQQYQPSDVHNNLRQTWEYYAVRPSLIWPIQPQDVNEVLNASDGEGTHCAFVTAAEPSAYNLAPKMLRIGEKIIRIGLSMYVISYNKDLQLLLEVLLLLRESLEVTDS